MKDLTRYFIDLSKLSEEERKHIISLLPDCCWNGQYVYNAEFAKHLKYNSHHQSWVTGLFSNDKRLEELTYPEFIKLFEGGKTIKSDNTQTLYNALEQIEKLEAEKKEILHFLKYLKQCVEDEDFIMVNNTDEDVADNVLSKMNSLIQKMKQ